MIIHAGDLCTQQVLGELGKVAPVVAVRGNQDDPAVVEELPERVMVDEADARITVVHGHQGRTALSTAKSLAIEEPDLDCIIFGHSHQAYVETVGTVLLFNPGSPTWMRHSRRLTFGVLEVDAEGIHPTIHEL